MTYTRLGAIDDAYLVMEAPNTPLHVASVGIFEGRGLCTERGRLRLAHIQRWIESRLDQLPRLRQRVESVPFDLARPVWVDDDAFDIAHHVDAVALGRPNDEAALLRAVEDLVMQPLDRGHPLWHLRFITGLEGGRVALVERAHHAMVDGVSGVDISLVLLDPSPRAGGAAPASTWVGEPPPSPVALVRDAAAEALARPADLARSALSAARHPRSSAKVAGDAVRTITTLRSSGLIAPPTSLRGELGATRTLAFVRQVLGEVAAIAAEHGATVNDVALTAVANGLRALFVARGEALPSDRTVHVLVPVSVRVGAEANALGNRVGGLVTPLPIGIGDPVDRLHTIAATTRALKRSGEAATADRLLQAADLLPPFVARRIVRAVDQQPLVSMVVTNVPGPSFPLYALGSRMLEAFPVVPLGAGMTLEVALLSYDGQLNLSVTADRDACPDVEVFSQGVADGFAQLVAGRSAPATAVQGSA
jgi:diacylglycerol O-acyltransferase